MRKDCKSTTNHEEEKIKLKDCMDTISTKKNRKNQHNILITSNIGTTNLEMLKMLHQVTKS